MKSDRLELIVDTDDTYQGLDNVFYINPNRLSLLRCLKDKQFDSCLIKNSPVETLTSLNFSYMAKKLKASATVEVIIYQHITVMQEYDAKQVEANAKLAGFSDFETKEYEFVDKAGKKFKTLSVQFIKPLTNPNETTVAIAVTEVKPQSKQNTKTKGKDTTPTTATVVTTTTVTKTTPVVVKKTAVK